MKNKKICKKCQGNYKLYSLLYGCNNGFNTYIYGKYT